MQLSAIKPQLRDVMPGDWLMIFCGACFTLWLALNIWHSERADTAIVRSGGKIFRELPLAHDTELEVPGPLGISRISIHNRQARVSADPSPRQYCVKQGWLAQAGEAAICLPNQVSLELKGSQRKYDSINY